ncbi:unnamed protein product [Amoebophrya sp. A120]|nr:unnamed protein product [Amoebophrya sp. A120]|eukprot:GSA120T00011836001.1
MADEYDRHTVQEDPGGQQEQDVEQRISQPEESPVRKSLEAKMQDEKRNLVNRLKSLHHRFVFWFCATFAVNLSVAIFTLLIWSHIGYGASSYRWAMKQTTVGFFLWYGGFFVLFLLYLLDFFTAPYVTKPSRSEVQALIAEERATGTSSILDEEALKQAAELAEKNKQEAPAASPQILPSAAPPIPEVVVEGEHKSEAPPDSSVPAVPAAAPATSPLPSIATPKMVTLAPREEPPALPNSESTSTVRHLVWGNRPGEVNEYGTFFLRFVFIITGCMALCWGVTATARYPHYPVMIMLIMLALLQVMARYKFRPKQTKQHDFAKRHKGQSVIRVIASSIHDPHRRYEAVMEVLTRHLLVAHDKLLYYKAFAISTLLTAMLVFNIWLHWAFIGEKKYWGAEVREEMVADGVQPEEEYDVTENQAFNMQFNIWAAPVLFCVGLALLFGLLSLRAYLHIRYTKTDDLLTEISRSVASVDHELGDSILGVGNMDALVETVKICVCGLFATALTFWVAAEVGVGASSSALDISTTVRTFIAALLFAFVVIIAATMRRLYAQMLEHMWKNPFLKITISALQSDWLKALFLLLFWWMLPFYYLISALNKLVRDCRGVSDQQYYDPEKTFFLPDPWHSRCTKACSAQLGHVAQWNKTSVISKAYVWALAVFTLNVGCTKGLNLGLIGLGEVLSGKPAYQILIVWYIAGLVGFLLPPVPGPPVYLFGGLVVVGAFEKEFEDPDTGFWLGLAITSVVALILKLNACAMQQKCIGQPLGSYKFIRALVGVHTPTIRAIEVVLRQPGLTFGKCAILCGGPDWPVSVLTGILRCRLSQMLLGTCPIFIFVTPTVMTGAFKRKTDKIFVTLTALLLFFSVLLACAMGVAACYAIQEVLDSHGPLMTVPLEVNKELHWLDYKAEQRNKFYTQATQWSKLGLPTKFAMLFGFLLMSAQAYVFFWMDADCFGNLDAVLTQDKDAVRPAGVPLYTLWWKLDAPEGLLSEYKIQVVKRVGQYALLSLFLGTLIFWAYGKVLQHLAAPLVEAFEKDVDNQRAKWEKEQEMVRDEIEREMVELYPDDYELYLEHTGRPRLEPQHHEQSDQEWETKKKLQSDQVVESEGLRKREIANNADNVRISDGS